MWILFHSYLSIFNLTIYSPFLIFKSKMFNIEELKRLRKLPWKELEPGMVYLGGIQINNGTPQELKNYPMLTETLIEELSQKYLFLSNREVVVAETLEEYSPIKLSKNLGKTQSKLQAYNLFKNYILKEREKQLSKIEEFFIDSDNLNETYVIKNNYNSFEIKESVLKHLKIPSVFDNFQTNISMRDVLSKKIPGEFKFPIEEPIALHIVLDYSRNAHTQDNLAEIIESVQNFFDFIPKFLTKIKIRIHCFSEISNLAEPPLVGKELPRKTCLFSSFLKKALRHKVSDIPNKVILITNGFIDDKKEAIELGTKLKKQKFDYSQIILRETDECKEIAQTIGGNQICLDSSKWLNLALVEVFDRYLGLRTLAMQKDEEVFASPIFDEILPEPKEEIVEKKKEVKKFEFKRISKFEK